MKKIILTTLALFVATTFAVAQAPSKAAERKSIRLTREMQAIDQVKSDLASRTFVFYPSSYTLPYQNPVEMYNFGYFYLDFYPESMDIFLPFAINNGPTVQFNSTMVPYTNYKVVNSDGNNFVVTAKIANVSNSMAFSSTSMQDINLGVHISVNVMSGAAILTLTPDFSPAVSYQGLLRPNN